MHIAYVAGPYRDPRGEHFVVANIRVAREIALELWRMGFAVVCPHSNTALMGGALPDEVWLSGDIAIMKRCSLVVTAPRYYDSAGTMRELEIAAEERIPVFHWPLDRDGLALIGCGERQLHPWGEP